MKFLIKTLMTLAMASALGVACDGDDENGSDNGDNGGNTGTINLQNRTRVDIDGTTPTSYRLLANPGTVVSIGTSGGPSDPTCAEADTVLIVQQGGQEIARNDDVAGGVGGILCSFVQLTVPGGEPLTVVVEEFDNGRVNFQLFATVDSE